MKVMVIVKASAGSEAGEMPSQELLTAMGQYNQTLVSAGIMESGDGLKPSSEGYRVRFSGDERSVSKGPFAEINELIAGYWIWNVDSIEEALTWVKKCPNPMMQDSDIEIRPFFEIDDFAQSDPDGGIRAQEDMLRTEISAQKSTVNNYLFFSGTCEEAVNFYVEQLGAKVEMLMRFSECPDPLPEGMVPDNDHRKIMHCAFRLGDTIILASDSCVASEKFSGFSLSLTLPSEQDVKNIFNVLSKGGTVSMPLIKTFWSTLYGQVVDKFGVAWMVMVASE